MAGGLTDTLAHLGSRGSGAGTHHPWDGSTDDTRIDYVLAGPGWDVLGARVDHTRPGGRLPSDHWPVVADVALRPGVDSAIWTSLIRRLATGDRPAAARLLDETVGAGFWGFCDGCGRPLDRGAARRRPRRHRRRGAGAGLRGGRGARVRPAAGRRGAEAVPGSSLLHVRALAVAPETRRAGIARRLLSRVEEQAAEAGAAAAYLFAWLPAGQPEPAAVPFYLAVGYVPRPDIPDFYAAGSVASGAECPFCGAPPCRCAARPYVRAARGGTRRGLNPWSECLSGSSQNADTL